MTTENNDVTPVIFRRWPDGSIIALFPTIPDDYAGRFCSSYARIGSHSGADYQGVISRTTPTSAKEHEALKQELEGYPYEYRLRVYQRRTSEHLDALNAELARYR